MLEALRSISSTAQRDHSAPAWAAAALLLLRVFADDALYYREVGVSLASL